MRAGALLSLADALRAIDVGKSREMLDAATRVAQEVSENDNRTETLTAAAFACARDGRPDDALELLAGWEPGYRWRLGEAITDIIVIADRLGVLSRVSPREIVQLLSFEGDTTASSEIRQLSLLICALRGEQDPRNDVLSAAKELEDGELVEIGGGFPVRDFSADATASKLHRCLAASFAEAGNYERATEELRQVSDRGDHADALGDIVKAAQANGYAEVARIVTEEAPSHAPREPGHQFYDDELVGHTIRAWRLMFQVGRPGEALELIASLADHDRGYALEELLLELDRIDLTDRAPYLQRADELTHEIGSQYWRRRSALRALALAYAKARHERADPIAEEARSASRSDNSWWMREWLIFGAADVCAR